MICTIHQPPRMLFELFDMLLLMRRGGKVVYFGEVGEYCRSLVSYFEAIPGTKQCPAEYNPATWMLEVIGAGTGPVNTDSLDYADVYSKSSLWDRNHERLKFEFLAPDRADEPLPAYLGETGDTFLRSPMLRKLAHQRHQLELQDAERSFGLKPRYPLGTQVRHLLARARRGYWRAPEFSLNRMIVIAFVAVLNTMIFYKQTYTNAPQVQSRLSVISWMAILAGMYNLFTIMPFQIAKRALYFRETSSGMYSILAAVLSDGFVEFPYIVIETLLGVNIMYFGIGLQDSFGAWCYYHVIFFLYCYLMTFLGMFFANLMPNPQTATGMGILLLVVTQNFSGLLCPFNKLPLYYKPLYYLSPQTYLLEGMFSTQFYHDETMVCNPVGVPVGTDSNIIKIRDEICSSPFSKQLPFPSEICTMTSKEIQSACKDICMPPLKNQSDTICKGCQILDACTIDGKVPAMKDFYPEVTFFKNITGKYETAESYVNDFVPGYKFDDRFLDLVVLFGWCVVVRVLTVYVVLNVNHSKR